MSELSKEDLKILCAPFPKDRVGVKVQSLSKDKTKAMLVLYVQHTDVYARLEEVDPTWSCEVVSLSQQREVLSCEMKLTVKGVTRTNVGEGDDPKSAYSDALKRCAMLFGVGRYFYDSDTVWVPYDESRDRFKSWTLDDYNKALRPGQTRTPTQESEKGKKAPLAEKGKPVEASAEKAPTLLSTRSREELNRVLMAHYRPFLTAFPNTQFAPLLTSRYNVSETRLMTVEQLEDLIAYIEGRLKSVEPGASHG